MKKIVPILALLLFGTFAYAQRIQRFDKFKKYHQIGADLPALKIASPNHQDYTNKDFKTRHYFILILFSPTCPHCIRETKNILAHARLFRKDKVAFMARANMLPYLDEFEQKTQIQKYRQFPFGVDSANAMNKVYTFHMVPQINIYNKHHKLVKIFEGETAIDSLKNYLR